MHKMIMVMVGILAVLMFSGSTWRYEGTFKAKLVTAGALQFEIGKRLVTIGCAPIRSNRYYLKCEVI